ncbi:F-box associated domain containing protein [Tanacetum coccineum]
MAQSKRFSQSIPALFTEIIIEILLKLPVESLLRCKSVCKQWYSLVSDKHFIKTHYSLSSSNISFAHLVFDFESGYSTRTLKRCPLNDVLFDNSVNNGTDCFAHPYKSKSNTLWLPRFNVFGSCNGLLCILFEGIIFIYNPSTRLLKKIYSYCGFKDQCFIVYGFGYDELNDDYKVVEVSYDLCKVMIYSIKTGKWKNICDFPNENHLEGPGIYSNGALHWAEGYPVPGSPNKWKIHSLHLSKETYDEVLQPEYSEGYIDLDLGALGQTLCVLCNYSESHADLWVWKVYGVRDSWIKLASIPFGPTWHHLLSKYYGLKFSNPMCFSNDGKLLLKFGGCYFVFDSKNISFTLVKEIDVNARACAFFESLVPPNYNVTY